MIGIDIAGRADLVELTSYRHHRKMLGGELDLRVIRVELPVAHEGASLLPPDPDAAPNMPQCDRSPGPDVSGGQPPHTRPTSNVVREPDAPSSDGIPCRFGGVLPPGGRGPDDNRGFGLFHLPARVLLEPVVVAALRPARALTGPAACLERDVVLEVALGGGPSAARRGTGGVADLGQVPQHHPGIMPFGFMPVIATAGGDRPDRNDQVALPGFPGR